MKDLRADWRKWTRSERLSAVVLALGLSGITPSLLLFGQAQPLTASFLQPSLATFCPGGC